MPAMRTGISRANALTSCRLLLVPLLVAAIHAEAPLAAAAVFGLAVATDFADGWAARRFGEVTPFGALLDHAVDAIFVTAGTAALAAGGVLPAPLPYLIAIAFLQYALDSHFTAAGGLRASALGRWNGIAYYAIVAVPVVRDALGWGWPGPALVQLLGWALVATTLLSIADRLRRLLGARAAATPAPRDPGP